MSDHADLTYGQLHTKLKAVGFREAAVELDGKHARVFQHKTLPGPLIALPERDPSAPVEPFYLRDVLVKLKMYGLLPEANPLLT
jgi:hypothetical protein